MFRSIDGIGRRATRRAPALFAAAVLFLLLGCAPRVEPDALPPGRAEVSGVPFFAQEDHQCGPASLAGVLGFLGKPASPAELAAEVFRPDIRGSLGLDMALAARRRGLKARFYEGSAQDLADSLRRGAPLIVLLDNGLGPVRHLHFAVATGYGPEGVRLNSDQDRGLVTPWDSFLNQWNKTGRWTLWIAP
ncbi:MAG TPA: C39 family peptidase [Desulfovibrio sp.]|uniref:C39 family peptidase n=1 Tax=Desulfovibrio TaxID=872 RepID=UPI00040AC0D9|nr:MULTISPECIES: C39 family peptidase [Desulfovibrio]MDY0305660.1 C39 family peptidase [Desulfovibrionaceae bacterium]HMM40198.1 C39 family peptidase [Desulfovibrio sp.]